MLGGLGNVLGTGQILEVKTLSYIAAINAGAALILVVRTLISRRAESREDL